MHRVSRIVSAPASAAWELLVNTSEWTSWGPSILAVESADRRIKLGTRGRVRTMVGLWLDFEITEFEDQRNWAWKVGGISATGHEVLALDSHQSRVTFTIPWWAGPYALVCDMALDRIEARLRGPAG